MNILAIDPGDIQSGWCILDNNIKPVIFEKSDNDEFNRFLESVIFDQKVSVVVIEMIASYGMAVGKHIFDTCVWIGRFTETAGRMGCKVEYITRKDEKINLCGSMKAKDTNIRRALIDRFAQHDLKNGKGTKNNPDWFYGFKADIWAAYAVGVTWIDMEVQRENGDIQ